MVPLVALAGAAVCTPDTEEVVGATVSVVLPSSLSLAEAGAASTKTLPSDRSKAIELGLRRIMIESNELTIREEGEFSEGSE